MIFETEDGTEDENEGCKNVGFFGCSYNKDLYNSGIAVEKVANSDYTILQWLAMNFLLFTSHPSISKETFTDNLKMQKRFQSAPDDSLPSTYYEARKLITPFLVKKIKYDVCINDCIVYKNNEILKYADLQKCPKCGEDRFSLSKRGNVARRTFVYIPIGPRLARIYGESNLAKIVQCHPGDEFEGTDMYDIHQSPTWKSLYAADGYFAGNKMGVSLALELDGVNPYHNIGVQYSMTPIMITILNFPRHVRNCFGNIQLLGIIPSAKGNSPYQYQQDAYVDIFVDELLALTECTAYSAYHSAPIEVKIKLLLYILDYPGLSKLFHQHGSGSISGCHWCEVQGEKCNHLDKVIYLSNRSYLQDDDELRNDMFHFPKKVIDTSKAPVARNMSADKSYRAAYELAKNKSRSNVIATATGCKSNYTLTRLPGHNRVDESKPDACHTVKDVTQNIVNLLTGHNINLEKIVRKEENDERYHIIDTAGRSRSDIEPSPSKKRKSDQSSLVKSKVYPFLLTKKELKLADERALSIKPPIGFGLKPSPFFTKPGSLKSHDWKQIATQGVLQFCLRGCLSDQCRETLFKFFDCIADLCAECQNSEEIDQMEVKLNKAMACLERDFPVTLQNVTTHLLHHLPESIKLYGPVYSFWMYVFERFNSWLCKRCLNMRYPEATVIETYMIHDWCQFMVSTGRIPDNSNPEKGLMMDVETEEMEEAATMDVIGGKRNIIPRKRDLNAIHNACCKDCTGRTMDCAVEKYFIHREQNPVTKRIVTYTCSAKEITSSKTLSSYVSFEMDRGVHQQKLLSGKFLVFGRIEFFLVHESKTLNKLDQLAYIHCLPDCEYDTDAGLWKSRKSVESKKRFIHVQKLSVPLVTAQENDWIWFLNCRSRP